MPIIVTATPVQVIGAIAFLFAWRGLRRTWVRERRLFIWLLIGYAVITLWGDQIIQFINQYWIILQLLARAGFNLQKVFLIAPQEIQKIKPLVTPERRALAEAILFLLFAWWGNRPPPKPKKGEGDELIARLRRLLTGEEKKPKTPAQTIVGFPGRLLDTVPSLVLGGINGALLAYFVVPRVLRVDTTVAERTVITLPVADAVALIQDNLVNIVLALIVVALLRLFQTSKK